MRVLTTLIFIFVATHQAVRGVVIQCNFLTSNWGGSVGTIYYCAGAVTSAFNPTVVTNIQGQHAAGRGNADVFGITIDGDRSLSRFPKGIGGFYPNLTLLNWSQGNLTAITTDELEEFPNLRRIRLSINRIQYLEGDLFQRAQQLTLIELDNNAIQNVGYDLLTNLRQLDRVTFQQNPCINVVASSPQEIQALNVQLLQLCPPLITTTLPPTTTTTTLPPTTTTTTALPPTTTTTTLPITTTTLSTTTTTSAPACYIRCSMNDEADELRREITELNNMYAEQRISILEQANMQKNQRIISLENQLQQQGVTNARLDAKILELERKFREIQATP